MNSISVMLVDDHHLLIKGFEAALHKYSDINIIKTMSTLNGVLEAYLEAQPDVLILDVKFDGEKDNGLDACSRIISACKTAKIVILSQHDQDHMVQKAYTIGALAFVKKGDDIQQLVDAIRSASNGTTYFPPTTAQKLAQYSVANNQPLDTLNSRELQIFTLTADGYSKVEIAEELGLTARTIGTIVNDIKEKLSIDRMSEFTKLAIKHNLISLD